MAAIKNKKLVLRILCLILVIFLMFSIALSTYADIVSFVTVSALILIGSVLVACGIVASDSEIFESLCQSVYNALGWASEMPMRAIAGLLYLEQQYIDSIVNAAYSIKSSFTEIGIYINNAFNPPEYYYFDGIKYLYLGNHTTNINFVDSAYYSRVPKTQPTFTFENSSVSYPFTINTNAYSFEFTGLYDFNMKHSLYSDITYSYDTSYSLGSYTFMHCEPAFYTRGTKIYLYFHIMMMKDLINLYTWQPFHIDITSTALGRSISADGFLEKPWEVTDTVPTISDGIISYPSIWRDRAIDYDGSISLPVSIPVAGSTTGVRTMDDVLGMTQTDAQAGTGAGSLTDSLPGVDTGENVGSNGLPADYKGLSLPAVIISKFPFCIPFDLANAIMGFSGLPREAPSWTISLGSQSTGRYEYTVDFEQFNTLAMISRWGILIIFNIGLIMVTRKLIKG